MALTTHDRILIEQRVTNDSKSAGVAYLLWFFTGGLGGHRFYLGRNGSALAMCTLFILGWLTVLVGIGLIFFVILAAWALIDAFLIPGMVERQKNETRDRLTMSALASHRSAPEMLANDALVAER